MYKNILRGIFVILVGCCLLIWPSDSTEIILKVLGGIFIAAAVVILVYLLTGGSFSRFSGITVINICSIAVFTLLGFLLLLKTEFFTKFIAYLFGTVLIIYGILQLVQTYKFNKGGGAKSMLYIIPALIILTGIVFFLDIINPLDLFCVVFGVSLIFLGLSELFIGTQFRKVSRALKEEALKAAAKIKHKQVVDEEATEVKEDIKEEDSEEDSPYKDSSEDE